MTETPRSEHSQTRFSTPVSDLDDHRHQPESMPRIENTSPTGTRRGTVTSVNFPQFDRPDLLTITDALERHGMVARDFEHAIVDDEKSPNDSIERNSFFGRRGSASPMARRGTFRRPRDAQVEQYTTRSRSSSQSSRSVSPPNSVDAFADPRRRDRAGTMNSQRPPSDLDLRLHRTVSQGTNHQRRPTFSEESRHGTVNNDVASRHSSAEDDVCFPVPDEANKTYKIDFEELEEFVAENQTKTPIIHPLSHKHSKASLNTQLSKPRVFHDLRRKPSMQTVPKIVADGPEHFDLGRENAVDSGTELDDIKVHVQAEDRGHAVNPVEGRTNRWAFFSSELDDTIHAADLGGLLMPGETFRDLFELPPDSGMWWLDTLNPTEEEVFAICKAFGVHPLTREDILTQEAREKVELFKQYYFVCFRSFYQMDKQSEDFMEPVHVYAVVFREGLLTFTFVQNPHAANVRKRIGRLNDYISLSADWICYALIDDIVDSFGPVIHDIEHETDAIEDQVFTARAEDSRQILRSIGECRKKVMSMMRLLGGKADVIKGFAKRCNEQYSVAPRGDVGLYLSDIQDHVVTMMSNLSHFEKMLSRSHSNYLAQISVDSLTQGNAVNELLGKITVIATILVPLNLICGLFGMNVNVPGRDAGSLAWFFGILGVMCAFVATCLIVARRLKYV